MYRSEYCISGGCYICYTANMANITDITDKQTVITTLQAIRAKLDLTQEQLAERFGVAFATVNRWEGGVTMPQKAARNGNCCASRRGWHRR